MKFCPECENVMLIKAKTAEKSRAKGKNAKPSKIKFLFCPSCGHEEPFDESDKEKYALVHMIAHDGKDKTVILRDTIDKPVVTEEDREASEDFDYSEE